MSAPDGQGAPAMSREERCETATTTRTDATETESHGAWSALRGAELWARVIRVPREEIAYFKFLFESYEGVAIIRTVETLADGQVLIALLATVDFVAETDAILDDVAARGAPPFSAAPLPALCTEDWFLSTWVRDAEG